MEGMAYGAGKAGGAFDPLTFFRQPQTILRIVSWLFALVIFGCIANEGYVNRPDEVEEYCIFNRNQNACNYGVAMGTLAFLCCLGFLALDVYFPQISSVKDRKKAVLADIGVSGEARPRLALGGGANSSVEVQNPGVSSGRWPNRGKLPPLKEGGDAARAAITFSFLPHLHHRAAQAFLGYQRYKLGADSALFSQEYADPSQDPAAAAPYSAYPGMGDMEAPPTDTEPAYDGSAGYQGQNY
ncbi:hypothetical protein GJAV_G00222650 [Gymnothorax javanicus]|nr:hypothetical protein GJAV_G00222650 [Gymnothorax javanicus]